jgi:serine/threonine protein phosphatase PrpC
MKVRSCAISDVGRKRQKNEDSYLINGELNLFIVADGMGGHAGGEFASRIAITTIEDRFSENANGNSNKENKDVIKTSIHDASAKIIEKAEEDQSLKGMGTTVICLNIHDKKSIIGHVGDSRGYLFRDGILEQLTEDHSLVNEQIKSGLITEEEAKHHAFKNIITRSVGVTAQVEVDIVEKKVKNGDFLVLCTDGLSNLIEQSEMEHELREHEPIIAAKRLVDLANSRGGDDNITLIIVEVAET